MIDITVEAFAVTMAVIAVLTALSVVIEYITDEMIERRIRENSESYDDAEELEDEEK